MAELDRGGFTSLGENLKAIAAACSETGCHDPRLVRAPTGVNENDPAGGGFLVASRWASVLVGLAYEAATLAPLTDRRETANPIIDVKDPGDRRNVARRRGPMGWCSFILERRRRSDTDDVPAIPKYRIQRQEADLPFSIVSVSVAPAPERRGAC